MKNIIYLLLAFLILGCEKEDKLTPKIELENLYGIQDDPSDPIKHRVFEIYKKYGVPVYFNDTIGRIFLKNDVNGNAVYRYETLDLAWNYSSYDGVTYEYEYMTDPEEQTKALDIIEAYLELVPKALYPFNFFVTESAKTLDVNDKENIYTDGSFANRYRTVFMAGNWVSEEQIASQPEAMKLGILKSKIMNYRSLLTEFNEVSHKSWYYQIWHDLDPNIQTVMGKYSWCFDPVALDDNWWGLDPWYQLSSDEIVEIRALVRSIIGNFGFVYGHIGGTACAPATTDEDLETFITEVLRWSRKEFEELWGACPLVMAKYEILYDVITNKIGVEL